MFVCVGVKANVRVHVNKISPWMYRCILFTQVESICGTSTRLALLHLPGGTAAGVGLMSSSAVLLFHLAPTRLRLPLPSCVVSPMCSESLQAFVSVLSRVDAGGEVEAPPSAAAATASGISPVSTSFNHSFRLLCIPGLQRS